MELKDIKSIPLGEGFERSLEVNSNFLKFKAREGTYYQDKRLIDMSNNELMDAIIDLYGLIKQYNEHINQLAAISELRRK